MIVAAEYRAASGPRRKECHWLAYRYPKHRGFESTRAQSWVVQCYEERMYAPLRTQGHFTDLWRSPSGATFVSHALGSVFHNPVVEPLAEEYQQFDVRGRLRGVWGLDDEHVFTWGEHDGEPVMYRFDGDGFRPIDSPGRVLAMHGTRSDLLVAVGDGFVARLDGEQWSPIDAGEIGLLSSVFLTNRDEIFAVGPGRQVLRGTPDGVDEVLQHERPLDCVAVHQDRVWIGSENEGLFELVDDELLLRKDDLKPRSFDARDLLLMSCATMIADTPNHESYKASPVRTFLHLTRETPLAEDL